MCTLRQVLPTADERERLLDVYRRRVAEHTAVDPSYGPRWRLWCLRLLADRGALVVPPVQPESRLDDLLHHARVSTASSRLALGEDNACHANSAALWIDGAVAWVGTGYALSDDGLWRQHSWGIDRDGTLVETTDARTAYYGLTVASGLPVLRFAVSNAQEYFQHTMRQGGARAQELKSQIRQAYSNIDR